MTKSVQTTTCQLLVDPPATGSWNMAADEVMLDAAVDQNTTSLRFYQWQNPTLSLGYFQRHADCASLPRGEPLPMVRRLSGGGALLHDNELTYSLALPASHPLASQNQSLYQQVHNVLIDALSQFGIQAIQFCVGNKQDENHGSQCADADDNTSLPFLCFQRFCAGDVILQNCDGQTGKIVGSAQRRRRGAILQHGSILLASSPHTTELPGIGELTGIRLVTAELVNAISFRLAARLALDLLPSCRMPSVPMTISRLQLTKYNQAAWNERR